MSRAFVSEEAAEATAATLPERPISAAPNRVTPNGLRLIDAEITRLQHIHAATAPGDPARATADRDLRYWRARRAAAILMPPLTGPQTEIAFGCRVTIRPAGGNQVTYTIVGEDEADPPHGRLAWTSPLATALLGARPGDEVDIGPGRPAVTVESIAAA